MKSSALAFRSPWVAAVLRVQAFVLLVLLGVGPALPALHFGSVEHEVCADHGEVRHVEHHVEQGAEGPVASGSLPSRHVAVSLGASADDHHDHCAVAATGILPATLGARWASSFEQPASSAVEVAALHGAQSHVSIALLAYAPKLAPPAFG